MGRSTKQSHVICITSMLLVMVMVAISGCRFIQDRNPTRTPIIPRCTTSRSPANILVSQYYHQLKPRRIVIAVPVNRGHSLPEQSTFAKSLANSFRQVGFVDAVVAPSCSCDMEAIRRGKFDLQQLVDLSQRYSADAVLYCDVASFSSYAPLQASVSMTLVDARESIAIMAVDGNWDLRDLETQNAYMNFLSRNPTDSDFQRGIKFQSPTEFLHFISLDVATFMKKQ